MSRHKNAPTVGQTEQGALIQKRTTNTSTHSDPLAAAQQTFVQLGALYSQFARAVMINADDPEVEKAIRRFMKEYDSAAKALHDERARAALRHSGRASKLAAYLNERRHSISLLRGVRR